MKIETVAKINLKGDYEVLYMGSDRGVARKVFKEKSLDKDSYLAIFHQGGHSARRMSKSGFMTHAINKRSLASEDAPVEEKPKRGRKKKVSEE